MPIHFELQQGLFSDLTNCQTYPWYQYSKDKDYMQILDLDRLHKSNLKDVAYIHISFTFSSIYLDMFWFEKKISKPRRIFPFWQKN